MNACLHDSMNALNKCSKLISSAMMSNSNQTLDRSWGYEATF